MVMPTGGPWVPGAAPTLGGYVPYADPYAGNRGSPGQVGKGGSVGGAPGRTGAGAGGAAGSGGGSSSGGQAGAVKTGPKTQTEHYLEDLNKRISTYETKLQAYEAGLKGFEQRWAAHVQEGQFVGNDEDYKRFRQESDGMDHQRLDLSFEEQEIKSRTQTFEQMRAKDLEGYTKVSDSYVRTDEWNKLPAKYQMLASTQGLDVMNSRIQADNQAGIKKALVMQFDKYLKDDMTYDLTQAYKDGIGEATIANAFGEQAARGAVVAAGAAPKGGWGPKAPTAWQGAGYAAGLAGDLLIPGFATVRHWGEMSAGQKALSITLDALVLLPVVGAAAKGAREAVQLGRAARLAAAARGVGKEALAQVTGPYTTLRHPVETVKGIGRACREALENIGFLNKVPEAVITTSESTVRLPVTATTTEAEAMKIRDTLMELAAKGEKPVIEFNGQRYELSRSAFMREVGGGLAHATPSGKAFESGTEILAKPGMPPKEQGLFMSHEPLPRFAKSSAFGTVAQERPAFLITSPEVARDAISSEKIYASPAGRVAEMERKFPVGYELPEPKQRLFTRIGPERTRVDILLDKPLTKRQILKLKALALVEDLKAPFKPSLVLSGTGTAEEVAVAREGLTAAEAERIARELERAGNRTAAATFRQVSAAIRERPTRLERTATRPGLPAERITVRATGRPLERVSGIVRLAGRAAMAQGAAARRERPQATRADGTRASTTRSEPTRTEAPRTEVERAGTPRMTPPRAEAPREEPSRPPREEPPRQPRVEPPRVEPPRSPRGEPPKKEPPEKPSQPDKTDKEKPWTPEDIANATVLKAGFGWWLRTQDGRLRFFMQLPPGAKPVGRGEGSGYRSAQTLSGRPVEADIHLGAVTAHLHRPGREPGRKGAVSYSANPVNRHSNRPALGAKREGRVLRIPGVGLSRRMPKGRIFKRRRTS